MPRSSIRYQLPETGKDKIVLYNLLGQKFKTLVNQELNAGSHKVIWNDINEYGSKVASGLYIYRMQVGDFVDTKKMMVLK